MKVRAHYTHNLSKHHEQPSATSPQTNHDQNPTFGMPRINPKTRIDTYILQKQNATSNFTATDIIH